MDRSFEVSKDPEIDSRCARCGRNKKLKSYYGNHRIHSFFGGIICGNCSSCCHNALFHEWKRWKSLEDIYPLRSEMVQNGFGEQLLDMEYILALTNSEIGKFKRIITKLKRNEI